MDWKLLKTLLPFALADFLGAFLGAIKGLLSLYIISEFHLHGVGLGATFSASLVTALILPLPLGSLMDYYGARRVQLVLFMIATIGMGVFAAASGPWMLFSGQLLISIGLGGGLIAGFKSVRPHIPLNQIPLFDGIVLGLGVAGGIFATVPAEQLLRIITWRELVLICMATTLMMAAWFYLQTNESTYELEKTTSLKEQILKNQLIFKSSYFWRIVFLVCIAYGCKMAFLNLWAAQWLHTDMGWSPALIAKHLLASSIALTIGDLSWGIMAERLSLYIRASVIKCLCLGSILFISIEILLMFHFINIADYWPWFLFGFFSRYTTLGYSALAQHFAKNLVSSTATAINTCFYSFAFLTQLGMGIGQHYYHAFGIDIILQTLGLITFLIPVLPRRFIVKLQPL